MLYSLEYLLKCRGTMFQIVQVGGKVSITAEPEDGAYFKTAPVKERCRASGIPASVA